MDSDALARAILAETTTTASKTADGFGYVGAVDGTPFWFKSASASTAERERDRALRKAAAWQAIIDAGLAR